MQQLIAISPVPKGKNKSFYQKGICTLMFIAVLFTVAKTWNVGANSISDEIRIRKMWYIYIPWNTMCHKM